jgi:predicted Zn-dependent protease
MKGIYYDGATSKPFNIELEYGPGYIQFYYTDSLGNQVNRNIPAKNIQNWLIAGSNTVIKIGDFPYQTIQIEGILEKAAIEDADPNRAPVYRQSFNYSSSRSLSYMFGLFIAMGVFLVSLYLWVVPWVAVQIAMSSPPSFDKSLGDPAAVEIKKDLKQNKKASELLNEFARELKLDTSKFSPRLTVIEEETVNAFALPGGNMMFYSGLIDKMESAEELAGVLGHEWGHVVNRHSVRQLVSNLSAFVIVSAVLGDAGGITAVLVENADAITRLSYSRNMESESDDYAIEVLHQNNLDPMGVSKSFTRLKESSKPIMIDSTEVSIPEFLTTHPDIESRISTTKEAAKKKKTKVSVSPALQEIFDELKEAVKETE